MEVITANSVLPRITWAAPHPKLFYANTNLIVERREKSSWNPQGEPLAETFSQSSENNWIPLSRVGRRRRRRRWRNPSSARASTGNFLSRGRNFHYRNSPPLIKSCEFIKKLKSGKSAEELYATVEWVLEVDHRLAHWIELIPVRW